MCDRLLLQNFMYCLVQDHIPTLPRIDSPGLSGGAITYFDPIAYFDIIVICYCKWVPIESVLEPLAKGQVTVDSFAGNEAEYREYLERNASQVEVG